MRKQLKTLLILMVCIVGLCGALAAAHSRNASPASGESSAAGGTDEADNTVLLQKDESEVKTVIVMNDSGGYQASADDSGLLVIQDLSGLPVDSTELSDLKKYAACIRSQDEIKGGADRLADFGLDQPAATVQITYTDGTSAEMSIGAEVPSAVTASRYVLWDGTVRVMYELHVSPFLEGESSFLSRQITPVYDSEDPNYRVTYLSVTGAGRDKPLTIEQTGTSDYGQGMKLNNYEITSPVEGTFDLSKEDYLTSFFGISAKSVAAIHPSDADWEKYGLSEPYASVDAKYQDLDTNKETEIHFDASKPGDDGTMYVAVDGVDLIYQCKEPTGATSSQDTSAVNGEEAPSGLTWMNAKAEELLARTVLTPYMNNVSGIEIQTEDQTCQIEITQDKDGNVSAKIDGQAVGDISNFNKFYYVLISQEAQSLLTDEEKAKTDLDSLQLLATFTWHYRDGSKDDVVTWYGESKDSRSLTVARNGKLGYRFSYSSLELILKDLKMVMDGEEITVRY